MPVDELQLQAARREFDAWSALSTSARRARIATWADPDERALFLRWLDLEEATTPAAARDPGAARPEWVGQQLGSYRLTGVLGEGGMGRVFAAVDLRDGRDVAIKRVRPGLATPTLLRRLAREFELMGRVDHPGIVRPLALEADDDGSPYLVLQRVRGVVLSEAELLRPARERVVLITRAAHIAGVAHAAGIVHRDIKPANLMIGDDDAVYLLDFGIAKPVAEEAMTALTQTGERMLTPRYAAPEQFRGEDVTAAADVYALGTMLLDSVFGVDATVPLTTPLTGNEAAQLRAIIQCARDPLPERRYRDASALAADLDRWLAHRTPEAARWHRRFAGARNAWIAVAAVLALITIVLAVQWHGQRRAEPIDRGLGLRVSDLDGLPRDNADALLRALAADAAGDRARALALMRAADAGHPDHVLPVLYLATWEPMAAQAAQRARLDRLLAASNDVYLGLLRASLQEEGKSRAESERVLRAALDLRPDAWKLRLALGHLALTRGDDAAARRELAAIDPAVLDPKRATIVLGDRAMLGDGVEVLRQLPALRARDPISADVIVATVAFARGECEPVLPQIDRTIAAATVAQQPDLVERARYVGLLCRGQLQRWEELLEHGRALLRAVVLDQDEHGAVAIATLAAIAAARLGQPDEASRLLASVDAANLYDGYRLDLALTRRMLALPDDVLPQLLQQPGMLDEDALASMARVFIALAAGDRREAETQLAAARRDGIRDTLFAIHADWLGQQLGEPPGPDATRLPMLWYPPTSRWAARW